MTTYNIGDKIEVIGTDGIYTTYQEMADLLGSKLYRSGARPNLMEFEIVNKREHLRLNEMVYLLKNSDGEFLFTDDCNGTRFILIEMAKQEGPFLQTGEEFEHTKTLNFIYERLIEVHGENSNFDYMHKLKNAIATVEDRESPCNQATLEEKPKPESEYDKGMREAMQKIAVSCGKKFAVDIGYEELPDLVESLVNPKQENPKRVKVEYVKVEDSIFDLRPDFEAGELFVKIGDNYEVVLSAQCLATSLTVGSCYRRVETEIDERQEFIERWASEIKNVGTMTYKDILGRMYDSANSN